MFFGDDSDFAPICSTAGDLTVVRVNDVPMFFVPTFRCNKIWAACTLQSTRVHTPAHVDFQSFGDVASGIYVCRAAREYFGPRQFALGF